MKYRALALLIISLPISAQTLACKIEDWRWYVSDATDDTIWLEGTTTCRKGKIAIRAYDGDDNFLGMTQGYITGYTFKDYMDNVRAPQSLSIRYSIE